MNKNRLSCPECGSFIYAMTEITHFDNGDASTQIECIACSECLYESCDCEEWEADNG